MTRRKLDKLKRELAELRRSPQKAIALQSLARRLGRKPVKRGKEPMWESEAFGELFVLAIPDHGGRDLPRGTRNSILDQLEEDIIAWEARLGEEDDGADDAADEEEGDGGSNGAC
jgi:hypothetical protein